MPPVAKTAVRKQRRTPDMPIDVLVRSDDVRKAGFQLATHSLYTFCVALVATA